jgi:lysophospholipase L1-like esterase
MRLLMAFAIGILVVPSVQILGTVDAPTRPHRPAPLVGHNIATTASPACADISTSGAIPGTPVRILAIGDSITAACQWLVELDRLLTKVGVPHVISTYALAGSRCGYWDSSIDNVLSAARPDLVYLYCGTNDDPAETLYGEKATTWSYRHLVETIHTYRPAKPALVVPTLIGYSDGTMAPDWLWAVNESKTNDALWSQMTRYMPPKTSPSWYAGIANIQIMPGTAEYLEGDTCLPSTATCGLHPNAKGYRTVGRMMYDAAADGMGWPAANTVGEPPLCGMSGHRKGYPRPGYRAC